MNCGVDLVVVACNSGFLDCSILLLFGLGDHWTLPHLNTSPLLGFTKIELSFSVVL
jgi:hypothetical protein